MTITAKNQGIKRELVPAGNHVARCFQMIHIGTVQDTYKGEPKKFNKVRISWELPDELRVFNEEKGQQPMVISKEYTLSMNERANLRKDLESWRGKGFTEAEAESFDISKLLGVPCMLNIIHKQSANGGEYSAISSIGNIPKGLKCPPQYNETVEFGYEDNFDPEVLENFPDFIKDAIKSSEEYKELTGSKAEPVSDEPVFEMDDDDTDDLPF